MVARGPGRSWDGDRDEAQLEVRLRTWAPPAVLALALVVYGSGVGAGFFRTFISMWLHELGHAVTSWLAGYGAMPGPWRTVTADQRSLGVVLLVVAVLGVIAWRAWQHEPRRTWLVGAAAAVLLVQLAMTLGLRTHRAQAAITFGGDAGGMVIGTLLGLTFYAPRGSHLHESWLRWGFLVIGSFGFMDPFRQWWSARKDRDVIPYGEIDGVGTSDPTRLVDDFGWSESAMVSRYVTLGVVCLLVMAVAYVLGLRAARRTAAAVAAAAVAKEPA